MSKVTMLNMAGQEAGELELKDEIFGIEPNQNAAVSYTHLDVYKRQGCARCEAKLKTTINKR